MMKLKLSPEIKADLKEGAGEAITKLIFFFVFLPWCFLAAIGGAWTATKLMGAMVAVYFMTAANWLTGFMGLGHFF